MDLGLESPSNVYSCSFVSIRGSKPPLRVSSLSFPGKAASGLISGWKARATCIRVHSCPFVVPTHPFAFPPCPSPAKLPQDGSRAGKPELRVFVFHSCPFVVPNQPFAFPPCPSPAKLPQDGSRAGKPELSVFVFHSCPFVVPTHPSRFLPVFP
jgi:hypothetical protein